VPTRDHPSLAIIMVSYRTGDVLFDALAAALANGTADEVILVNHVNPPEHVDRLIALDADHDKLKVIHTRANLGFARGCNIGAREARSDALLFLNPDAILSPGAAAAMLETLMGAGEPAIVGARLLDLDGRDQRGGRRGELTFTSAMAGFLGLSKLLGLRDIHREREPLPDGPEAMPAVSGAAMMMTRRGFDQLTGFDERYFLHVEDLDICRRARELGGEVIFDPRASVVHHGSTSKVSLFKVERWKAGGLIRYFRRHGGALGWLKALVLAVPIYAALLGRAALLRLRG
jgi:N-acetylglucosaminyl-diphospho-decaprenol L-rhamnosyltransferase